MEINDISLLVIPDVHGRKNWKRVMSQEYDKIKKVFLGDYVDPYTHIEGITKREAIDNFNDIIGFAKSHDNVVLLLGNHDCSYAIGRDLCMCRHDNGNHGVIAGLFEENRSLFRFTHSHEAGGKRFLLSHAGIMRGWLTYLQSLTGKRYTIEGVFNDGFGEGLSETRLFDALSAIPFSRGGDYDFGSIIWADENDLVKDMLDANAETGIHQVVGHSWMKKPFTYREASFIDTGGDVYAIDNDGHIRNLESGDEVKTILI